MNQRSAEIDTDRTAGQPDARAAWFRAAAVGLVLAMLASMSTGPARRTFDSLVLSVFPHRVTLQVAPGNVRVRAGAPVAINARLVGASGYVDAQVEMGDGVHWHTVDMRRDEDGRFRLRLDAVTTPFKYRVLAGALTSPTYSVELGEPSRYTQ